MKKCLALMVMMIAAACVGCDAGPDGPDGPGVILDPVPGVSEFTTYDPRTEYEGDVYADGADAGLQGGAGGAAGGEAQPNANGDANRAVEEADILQTRGDTLYALSRYRGLVLVDLSEPDDLAIVGNHPIEGVPFEMYLRDNVAYVILSSFWTYEWDVEQGGSGSETAKLLALDVSDPGNIRQVGEFDLDGAISDSRLVGDVLYTVTSTSCWGCEIERSTNITSINLADLANPSMVDQIAIEDEGWDRKSIHVNQQRAYVASYDWMNRASTIDVIDISDPDGTLVKGAAIQVSGMVDSRWQMNEHDGYFRVISQPWDGADSVPVVETYQLDGPDIFEPVGRLEMVLPRPESLMSVRFDGDRAYAVTFERTDPLFVIDLADPANPVQRGELEIPGWLYHMVPQGDRLLAIGFDQQEESSLAVSLFDVSDMDAPRQISRVNFGAQWGFMPEDQDRIHKAFKILPEEGLVLMPYAGWSRQDHGCGEYTSGIQLIDWTDDTLIERGVARHRGSARRAFLHGDRLFALSDERVEAFDISNRDAPLKTETLIMARTVYRVARFGDYVAQLSSDWWSDEALLDINPVDDVDSMEPLGRFPLAEVLANDTRCGSSFYYGTSRLFTHEDRITLVWSDERNHTRIAIFDVSDPSAPRLLATHSADVQFPYQMGWWNSGIVENGNSMEMVGHRLVLRRSPQPSWHYDCWDDFGGDACGGDEPAQDPNDIHVIDLTDPADIQLYAIDLGGEDRIGAIITTESGFVTSHKERVPGHDDLSRFFLDRIDLSGPEPVRLPSINIPGSVIDIDAEGSRLVTVDYTHQGAPARDYDECVEALGTAAAFDWTDNTCGVVAQSINVLTIEGDLAFLQHRVTREREQIRDVHVIGDTVLVGIDGGQWWDESVADPRGRLSLYQIEEGELRQAGETALSSPYAWLYGVVNDKAVVMSDAPRAVMVYDLSDPESPALTQQTGLTGYGYDVLLTEDTVISANASGGVQVVDLNPPAPLL